MVVVVAGVGRRQQRCAKVESKAVLLVASGRRMAVMMAAVARVANGDNYF
jgi:hypothetical protein